MAAEFSKPALSSVPVRDNPEVVIQMLTARPATDVRFTRPDTPGRLAGYYNSASQVVELYVVAANGIQWVRVR